jgi:hypothetical protein
MNNQLECPVDFISVNENKVRTVAFFVMSLSAIYLATGLWIIFAFLSIDFFLRANNLGKYSLLALISDALIKQFKIGLKPVDQGPKRFAALIGFIFSLTILILSLTHLYLAANVFTVVLLAFAFLESIVGFCAGCYAYTYINRFKRVFKSVTTK